jgi:hypothetical protein
MGDQHGVPTVGELAEAVREFLELEVMPAADDRLRFRARVAANAVAQIERELAQGVQLDEAHRARLAQLGVTDDGALARAIRDGSLDERMPEVLGLLRASAAGRVLVSNPRYLLPEDHDGQHR